MLIRIVLALVLAASLGACKTLTTGGGSAAGPQPSPQLTGSDEARFFSKSGLTACAGGALVGLATCKLSNTCDSDKGMITAALVGCGVGMGANYYLDQRRAEYANTEQRLDVMIADVREDNRKLQTLTATATDVLQQDRQKLATLKTQLAQQQVAKTAAQQQLAQVDANTRYLRTSLANLQKREQEWRQVAQAEQQKSQQHQQLNDEINRMQKQIISLQESVQDVEQQRAAIVLGNHMKPAALLLLLFALGGCATTAQDCDPAQRDANVLRKAGCVYGGHYQQRVEQKQAVLLDEQQANRLFQATYDALQQESVQVSADLVAQQVSLDRVRSSLNNLLAEIKTKAAGNQDIEQQVSALENRLQSLQLEIEMARSRGEALPVLQQRQQMAELQLGVQDLQAALGLR